VPMPVLLEFVEEVMDGFRSIEPHPPSTRVPGYQRTDSEGVAAAKAAAAMAREADMD